MTFTSPIGYGFPGYGRAYTDVQPFTYRAAVTQQELLESLRSYVTDTLAPHVDESFTAIEDDAKAIGAALEVQFQDAISDVELNAVGFTPLQGIGIDLTGGTDSTAAVQAFFDGLSDGALVVVPAGAIIALGGTITLTKSVTVTGTGELRWTAGIEHDPALRITADRCSFVGIHMTNPNHLAAMDGNRSYGIEFSASYGTVSGCLIDGFQNAIWVDSVGGEFHHHTITGNRVLNVPAGANTDDRGDGIYMCGAQFTVTGNVVSALAGADARIGIGAEALQSAGNTYPFPDMGGTIANNVVTGPFRRSIAVEGVENVAITGNSAIGFQWWGINIVGTAHQATCVGNTIRFTGNAAAGGQTYAGILVYDNPRGVRIAENTIKFIPGATGTAGICAIAASGGHSAYLSITNNTIDGWANQILYGIQVNNGADSPTISGNTVAGFNTTGIALDIVSDPLVTDNRIVGSTGTKGITTSGVATDGRVDGNTIQGCDNAINFYFRTGMLSVSRNSIKSCSVGIDLYGWTGSVSLMQSMNNFYNVPTHFVNTPTGASTTVTAIGNSA